LTTKIEGDRLFIWEISAREQETGRDLSTLDGMVYRNGMDRIRFNFNVKSGQFVILNNKNGFIKALMKWKEFNLF
jgi:hypothetical protein